MTLPILVVDDDLDTGKMMAKVFSAWGYDTKVAVDGPMALLLVQQQQFGIAIIDYRMPGMNGVELFHKMRELRPDLAAVFLTGHARLDVVFPAIDAGVLRVLSKPADLQELMPIVQEHLGPTAHA
jgi:two-component system response regulator (stage 0 sporulation protein F)